MSYRWTPYATSIALMTLFTISDLLKNIKILHVKGLLYKWRGGRDVWTLAILLSCSFLSSGCPALVLKNVLSVWKSVSVPANGQHLKKEIETSDTSDDREVHRRCCLIKKPQCCIAYASTHWRIAQGSTGVQHKEESTEVLKSISLLSGCCKQEKEEQSHRRGICKVVTFIWQSSKDFTGISGSLQKT